MTYYEQEWTGGNAWYINGKIVSDTRPSCACGATASACSWHGTTRRVWSCDACERESRKGKRK